MTFNIAQVLGQGAQHLAQWRQRHPPDAFVDCTSFDFTGWRNSVLANADLHGFIFHKAVLRKMHLNNTNFDGADLTDADLSGAKLAEASFKGARLSGANFEGADLNHADLTGANLGNAIFTSCSLQGAKLAEVDLSSASLSRARLDGCDLAGLRFVGDLSGCSLAGARCDSADFSRCNLSSASMKDAEFQRCDFTGCDMGQANLRSSKFTKAILVNANLTRAACESAVFEDADLHGANFYEAQLHHATFTRARGVHSAKNMHTALVPPNADVRYFDTIEVPFEQRWTSWETLRVFGKLPLFGASYVTLVAIPLAFYLLDIFNRHVDQLRLFAERHVEHDDSWNIPANFVLNHVQREPVPALSLLLLYSTVCLGIAATIYALACPTRIKEFSRDQWRDQLGHSLIHYLPLSWRYPWLRIPCLILYILGGTGVLFVLSAKLYNVAVFIIRNQ